MAVRLLLSRLAYEAIRGAVTIGGTDFSYDAYTKGEAYRDNMDWTEKEGKAWEGINHALARLSDYDRLPLFQLKEQVSSASGFQVLPIPEGCKRVQNVFSQDSGGYETYPFSTTNDEIILNAKTWKDALYVEYSKFFPHFSSLDVVPTLSIGDEDPEKPGTIISVYTDRNIDLAEQYHLTSEGFDYAKLMAEAEILRVADPSRANDLINIAENYFNDMDTYRPSHRQRKVAHPYRFW